MELQGVCIYLTNGGHGNNRKVEGGDITLPEIDVSEVRISIVTHLQATDPGVTLLGRGQSGGKIVKNASSGVSAVKFNDKELEDSGEQVIDPRILLEGIEELGDSGSTSESDPKQRADKLVVVGALVNEVPWETCEEVEEEARPEVPNGDLVVVEDQGEGVGVNFVIAHQELQENVHQENQLPRYVKEEYVVR